MRTSKKNSLQQLVSLLKEKKFLVVTAESCTGGGVAKAFIDIPGSSDFFDRGFITYNNQAKHEVLNVSDETLKKFGAISELTAREMAEGALSKSHADVSIAVTGNAGPTPTEGKPVGLVWFAWGFKNKKTYAVAKQFDGDREAVCQQSVDYALAELEKLIASN